MNYALTAGVLYVIGSFCFIAGSIIMILGTLHGGR